MESPVHRLVFGVTEKEGKGVVLRDWELLNVLNGVSSGLGVFPDTVPAMDGAGAEVEDLKQIFDEDISNHAPMLHRPISWPEILLLPSF